MKKPLPEPVRRKPIEELDLTVRSFNALTRRGVKTVGEILELTDEQLLAFKNLGRTSLVDIRRAVTKLSAVDGDQKPFSVFLRADSSPDDIDSVELWKLPKVLKGRLDADIDVLDLSVRATNVLRNLRVQRVGELINASKTAMLQEANCGRKTVKEIEARLFEYLESGGLANFNIRGDVQMLGSRALIDKLLSHVPERDRKVLSDRYGLWDGIAETLEDIGDKLGLTRERIRQIEAKSLNRLRRIVGSSLREFIIAKATANITARYGVLNEEELVAAFGDDCSPEEGALALNLLRDLEGVTDLFAGKLVEVELGVYCASAQTASEYKIGVALIQATLADNRVPIDEQQLWERIMQRSTGGLTPSRGLIKRILETSPSFSLLRNGTIVPSRWTASRKSRIASLAEGVLEKLGKPLHFTEIAKKINQIYADTRDVSEGSVHNVLVSSRDVFVWVKNGTYGLAAWGLKQPPSIKEAIIQILGESTYPMAYWFLKEKTLEVCNCKEASVRMTLDLNPKVFKKFAGDQYGLARKFEK
jgi:hypothetical protein